MRLPARSPNKAPVRNFGLRWQSAAATPLSKHLRSRSHPSFPPKPSAPNHQLKGNFPTPRFSHPKQSAVAGRRLPLPAHSKGSPVRNFGLRWQSEATTPLSKHLRSRSHPSFRPKPSAPNHQLRGNFPHSKVQPPQTKRRRRSKTTSADALQRLAGPELWTAVAERSGDTAFEAPPKPASPCQHSKQFFLFRNS